MITEQKMSCLVSNTISCGPSVFTGLLMLCILLNTTGCTVFMVDPPHNGKSGLSTAGVQSSCDFLISTEDLIDRDHPIGRIGDTFFGGQYQVTLSDSLHDYFEAEIVQTLQNNGYNCFRPPGHFIVKRLKIDPKPLILKLELQDLTLARHPKDEHASDHVIGICKIRGIVSDCEGNILHHRQFVGRVDTYRLTDELTLPFLGGWISRSGLSLTLEKLLQDTVSKFINEGIPEFEIILEEYRSNGESKVPSAEQGVTPVQPVVIPDSEPEVDSNFDF